MSVTIIDICELGYIVESNGKLYCRAFNDIQQSWTVGNKIHIYNSPLIGFQLTDVNLVRQITKNGLQEYEWVSNARHAGHIMGRTLRKAVASISQFGFTVEKASESLQYKF